MNSEGNVPNIKNFPRSRPIQRTKVDCFHLDNLLLYFWKRKVSLMNESDDEI